MKYFLTLLLLAGFSSIRAQKSIKLEEVASHIGDTVSVTGKVYGSRYLENSKGTPTLINLGAAYPNQLLTVVIFGEDRKKFTEAPETFFLDKIINVTGKLELFRDKPQILVKEPSQIRTISEEKKGE